MNFGQNLYSWLSTEFGYLLLAAIIVGALVMIFSKKLSTVIGVVALLVVASYFIFSTNAVKDLFVSIATRVFGGG